ncbi:helix-turn-helix domain-containing protein [Candidatus Margulisiibacteriota bacterium]
MEIKENEVYTSEEVKSILKISQSTFLRLIKKGLLNASKIGGQYRILGKELLRAVCPEPVVDVLHNVKDKIKDFAEDTTSHNGKKSK